MREIAWRLAAHEAGHLIAARAGNCDRWAMRRESDRWVCCPEPSNDQIGIGDELARRFVAGPYLDLVAGGHECRSTVDLYKVGAPGMHDLKVISLLRSELGEERMRRNLAIVKAQILAADWRTEARNFQKIMARMKVGEVRQFWTKSAAAR